MDFRSLLLGLMQMGPGFESHVVAAHFHMPLKRASNDLRRLWRMGFLRRTSVKRSCLTRRGKLCNKGYKYRYYLSRQGMKYVKWLQGGKMTEDFAYAGLTSKVLSHLPEELKGRLSLLSLAKATRRYKGPSRNMSLLDNNAVPVIHLLAENMRLQSENARLEKENTIQQIELQQTTKNHQGQNTTLSTLLAYAYILAAKNKNSAETWERWFAKAYGRLARLSPLEALSTFGRDKGNDALALNPTDGVVSSFFDPRTGISNIPAVVGRAGIGSPTSVVTSWREHYGKTYTMREITPEGPGRILATWKITPENAKRLVEDAGRTPMTMTEQAPIFRQFQHLLT